MIRVSNVKAVHRREMKCWEKVDGMLLKASRLRYKPRSNACTYIMKKRMLEVGKK